MKKTILKQLKVIFIIYLIVYSGYTFSIFEFKNPFQWIIDIPSYSNGDRFFLLFGWLLVNGVILLANKFPVFKK